MNADTLLENLDVLAEATDGISYLRELILEKAIRGQLVNHELHDQSQIRHLSGIRASKGEVLKAKVAGKSNIQRVPLETEFPFTKPSSWEFVRIDDTGDYINGCVFKAADQVDNGLPIIRIQNLTNAAADFNFTQLKLDSKNIAEPGDLLVSWSATLDAFKWQGERGAVNQHIFKVEPFNSVVESDFLHLLLKWTIRRLANSDALHGLAMKHINRGSFISSIVPLPPLAEQKIIVAKVDELMALCDQLEQQQKQRDNLRTATRKSAIDAISTATTPAELEAAWERINNNWDVIADTPESVDHLKKLIPWANFVRFINQRQFQLES